MRYIVVTIMICSFVFISCEEPHPLYGTWADNRGNTLSFFDDNTFNGKISSNGLQKVYEGNYSVLINSLTLYCTNEELTIVTEWDIRGNMLYIDWAAEDGTVVSMTLYKVSN